jgi:large subunit ribosomal protein L22
MKVHAKCKFLQRSPFKLRRFAQLIKGKPFEEAEAALMVNSSPACKEMLKVLNSAGANAENNLGLDKTAMHVDTVMIDAGPMLKRFRARARGRPGPILKRMSHITIVLEEDVPSEAVGAGGGK